MKLLGNLSRRRNSLSSRERSSLSPICPKWFSRRLLNSFRSFQLSFTPKTTNISDNERRKVKRALIKFRGVPKRSEQHLLPRRFRFELVFVESFIAHMILIRVAGAGGGRRRLCLHPSRLRKNKTARVVKFFRLFVWLQMDYLKSRDSISVSFATSWHTFERVSLKLVDFERLASRVSKLFHSSLRCSPVCRSDVRAHWTWQILSAMVYTNVSRNTYARYIQHKVAKQSYYYVVGGKQQ